MKQRWQFSLSSLLVAMAVLSVLAAIIARTGALGVILILLGGTLLMGIVGMRRGWPALAWAGFLSFIPLLAVSIPLNCTVAVWDGIKSVPLRFIVVDAANNQPISGTTVRLRESCVLPSLTVPPGEKGAAGTAGSDGTVALVWSFSDSGREGLLEHSGHIFFGPCLWIQASAPGYTPQLVSLVSLTGKSRDISDPIPPPMRISLVPKPAATAKP